MEHEIAIESSLKEKRKFKPDPAFARKANVPGLPMTLVTTVTPTITPATIQSISRLGTPLLGNSAESNTTWISSGFTTPSPADTRINNPTTVTGTE